jgi:hypothetical protein
MVCLLFSPVTKVPKTVLWSRKTLDLDYTTVQAANLAAERESQTPGLTVWRGMVVLVSLLADCGDFGYTHSL